MANWEWPSIKEKLEAIGYLAVPGVIGSIEPTVPKGKTEEFREEYKGKYSDEYPYEADKYGQQFRIYLNDTEGCPDFLREHLDGTYGNRINNTEFIKELVKEYGFKFTKERQDDSLIFHNIIMKHGKSNIEAFRNGYESYRDFVQNIEDLVKNSEELAKPNILNYDEKASTKGRGKAARSIKNEMNSAFSPHQILKLGWAGEAYITYLLKEKEKTLLRSLAISAECDYNVKWFNEGVQNAIEECKVTYDAREYTYIEKVKKWEDRSVGKGCDIIVELNSGDNIYIEVKTSKRTYPFFNMTSVEMQEMEKRRERYVLVKINNFERLLKGDSPDVITIINPFEKLFHPQKMKEATFIMKGE